MITGFDHAVIAVRDLAASVAAYETLLGRVAGTPVERDGVATAIIVTDNIAVELMAPVGGGEGARRLSVALDDGGEGLKSLVFAVDDLEAMHRRAERVGLAPEGIKDSEDGVSRSFRASTERTHGVRLFSVERRTPLAPAAKHEGRCAERG